MNKLLPEKHQASLTQISISKCPQHNMPYTSYCSYQSCAQNTRMCQRCKSDNPSHKNHPDKYFTQPKQVIADIQKGLQKCILRIGQYQQRIKQIKKIIEYSKNKQKQEYENIQIKIIETMRNDKESLEKIMTKMNEISSKLDKKNNLSKYFHELKRKQLLPLKIKLSNQQGIKNLKQKNQMLLSTVLSKSALQERKKCLDQFYMLKSQFDRILTNCTTFKIDQLIKMKNTTKKRKLKGLLDQSQQNEKPLSVLKGENKQKAIQNCLIEKKSKAKQDKKPRTALNFGQMIMDGIIGFFKN